MKGLYTVHHGREQVGKVELIPQGLYCRVICRCAVASDQVFRLYAVSEQRRENLGVLLPESDGLCLDRKIPVKTLGREPIRFVVSCGTGAVQGRFVPIRPEEPFRYIDRLKDAFLETENGKIGIRIQEHPEAV